MTRSIRRVLVVFAIWLAWGGSGRAVAQESIAPPMPSVTEAEPATPGLTAEGVAADLPHYGFGARTRWVSVPSWFLGLFTKQNVPLSSYGIAGEFVRRRDDMDIVVGLGWQKMGPSDGNWLGRGKDAAIDTDFVQFRNFGFIGADATFLWHRRFGEYVGMHYGAGLGVAIMTGEMLRISNSGCTEANAGNEGECRPRICPAEGCTEKQLRDSEGSVDNGPADPHRYKEQSIPGALPILHVLGGLTLRVPQAKGLEFRLETGFYNAFFFGLSTNFLY